MSTAIPDYYEVRLTLSEIDSVFREFIGGSDVIDIGETIRLMLADYFYGEMHTTISPTHTEQDRTIVFPQARGQTLFGIELSNAIEVMGEIFWSLADYITNNALIINSQYTHRPSDCLYKFYVYTRELVIYIPVIQSTIPTRMLMSSMDGRAVISACSGFLPKALNDAMYPS